MKISRAVSKVGSGLCAVALWCPSVFAQDAGGLDTGADDIVPHGQLVFPSPGATGVVLNAGLLVTLPGASLDTGAPSYPWADSLATSLELGEGLLLRDDAGAITTAGPLEAGATPRARGASAPMPDARVEIATRPLALAPDTHYEVLSRLSVCPSLEGVRLVCEQTEYVSIGDFTTGAQLDRTGPVITSLELGSSPGECLTALRVVASDDHAAPEALRVAVFDRAFLGPSPVLPTPASPEGETRVTLELVPLDPSNNRGPTFSVEVEACPLPATPFDDGYSDIPPLNEPEPPVVAGERGGCAFTPGSAGWESAIGALPLGALLGLRRARQRRRRS